VILLATHILNMFSFGSIVVSSSYKTRADEMFLSGIVILQVL
jgi:hypothetical protein